MALVSIDASGMAEQKPEELHDADAEQVDDQSRAYILEELDQDNAMYKAIKVDFEKSDLHVIKVERLKNRRLLKRFMSERKLLLEERHFDTQFKLNEKYLYHGTNAKKEFLFEEGLDSRMAKEGCFGKGIYFSDYPKKCVKYAKKAGNTEMYIFLMRVVLGVHKEYARGEKDRMLQREPEKVPPYKGWRFYDSVKGCPVNHNEFVIYQNQRAIMECIIHYSKPESTESRETSIENPDDVALESLGVNTPGPSMDTLDSDSESSDTESDLSEDDKPKSKEKGSSDEDSSDEKGQNSDDEDETDMTLERKKELFTRRTGEAQPHIVDSYMVRTDLDLTRAVFLFQAEEQARVEREEDEKNGGPKEEEEVKEDDGTKYFQKDTPLMDTELWNKLSEQDKEAIINGYIDDFLRVTALDAEKKDIARSLLTQTKMNLDHAIVAYYESF